MSSAVPAVWAEKNIYLDKKQNITQLHPFRSLLELLEQWLRQYEIPLYPVSTHRL